MNWRRAFQRLFFAVWILGSLAITLMVIHTLRIPLNPVQRILAESGVRPAVPDCSGYVPSNMPRSGAGTVPAGKPATIDEFLNRRRQPGLFDTPTDPVGDQSGYEPAMPQLHEEGCLKERDEALPALAESRNNSVYAYQTGIFWYRIAFLLATIAIWSVVIWGLFHLVVWAARKVNRRRGVFPADEQGSVWRAGKIHPSVLNPAKFDPEYGPIPIPGIAPPLNLVRLTWAEMKRVSDTFREFEIPGPGICLSCRKKGLNEMHPIEDMYTLMDGAKSDAMAGLSRKRSPFFVGTCRTCAPEIYETQVPEGQTRERSTSNATFLLCTITLCVLLLLLLVRA